MIEEKQKIVNLLKQYETGTNTGDAKLTASLYASEAVLMPEGFTTNVGVEEIFKFYDYAFSALQLNLDFEIDTNQISIAGDIAFATTKSLGTRLIRATSETVPENNRELWIFQRNDGEWKIIRYMFNTLN